MARVTRAEFAAASRTLIAKVPDLHNRGYFAKTDFQIDLEAGTCTCPNQQRAVKGGGGTFVFAPEICAACPRRAQCTGGLGGRTLAATRRLLLEKRQALRPSPPWSAAEPTVSAGASRSSP
ncbi:MAG: hypothetical protein JOZ87_23825 [Chloroflexi bacterium]|nr:hypothetical protein [Chloroflexota bacterium]